jgi:hypothetical protein
MRDHHQAEIHIDIGTQQEATNKNNIIGVLNNTSTNFWLRRASELYLGSTRFRSQHLTNLRANSTAKQRNWL